MARLRGDLGTAAAAMRPVNSDRATRRNKEYRTREKTDDRPLEVESCSPNRARRTSMGLLARRALSF